MRGKEREFEDFLCQPKCVRPRVSYFKSACRFVIVNFSDSKSFKFTESGSRQFATCSVANSLFTFLFRSRDSLTAFRIFFAFVLTRCFIVHISLFARICFHRITIKRYFVYNKNFDNGR